MVAPNSPSALAKHEHHAGDDAGQRERQRHGEERPEPVGAERRRGVFEPPVDRLERQPDGANQQRKRHHAAGQRRAGPAEREHDADVGEERRRPRPCART